MTLTLIEQLLLGSLRTSKASKGIQTIVFVALKEDCQKIDMSQYLLDNPEAEDKEILEAAKRIGGPGCGII